MIVVVVGFVKWIVSFNLNVFIEKLYHINKYMNVNSILDYKGHKHICEEEGYIINLLKFINLWSNIYHAKKIEKGKFSFLIPIATCLNDQKEYSIIHMNKVE